MKILYYYWAPLFDVHKRGGGIRIYQERLINVAVNNGDKCIFVSSGSEYTFDKKMKFKKTRNSPCDCYELLNSPILTPASMSFSSLSVVNNDLSIVDAFEDFIKANGEFDVFHIQSLEGLPSNIFLLKTKFPKMKMVLSMHNYYVLCPQVNLWYRDSLNCYLDSKFPDCVQCVCGNGSNYERTLSSFKNFINITDSTRKKTIYRVAKRIANYARGIMAKKPNSLNVNEFKIFRANNINAINKYCDCVIAVSEKTKKIALDYGIKPEIIEHQYIGTVLQKKERINCNLLSSKLSVIYMGYARKDKGFYFLIETIKRNNPIWKHVDLTLCCKVQKKEEEKIVKELRDKVSSIEFINGYDNSELDSILLNKELGIVPNLWEDNMPQVAIELVYNGVTILCSDAGGAQEIINDERFIFKRNDSKDMENKLQSIIENKRILLEEKKSMQQFSNFDFHYKKMRKDIYVKNNNTL